MRRNARVHQPALAIVIGLGLLTAAGSIKADDGKQETLGAKWQEWALSIPTPVNPQLDNTGANCMIGQRGSKWFLAGTFGGGTAMRTCSVPDDRVLFFPLINAVNINTPNVCGQGPANVSVKALRAASAASIDGATNVSAELDGVPVHRVQRMQSDVFAVALPEDNVFDAPCAQAGLGNVPAGIFSPAVDDGIYATIPPLTAATHTLHIHAENPSQGFNVDVTYVLNVVAVSKK